MKYKHTWFIILSICIIPILGSVVFRNSMILSKLVHCLINSLWLPSSTRPTLNTTSMPCRNNRSATQMYRTIGEDKGIGGGGCATVKAGALLNPLSAEFLKFTSYCSLKPLWSGMGEKVLAHTSLTLHPPSPPTEHQLSRLAL